MGEINEKLKFHYYCADLIDRFNRADIPTKIKIIESLPFSNDEYVAKSKIRSAYLAGVVEELCRRDNIGIPEWVNDDKYFLSEPIFGGGLENIKSFLIVESPIGFRRRNIFVSENAIARI